MLVLLGIAEMLVFHDVIYPFVFNPCKILRQSSYSFFPSRFPEKYLGELDAYGSLSLDLRNAGVFYRNQKGEEISPLPLKYY